MSFHFKSPPLPSRCARSWSRAPCQPAEPWNSLLSMVSRAEEEATTAPKRTPDEQRIIDQVAADHGAEFAEKHAHLILNQARDFGEL